MSTEFLIMAVIAVISYFIGSISTAILVGKILGGDDIRSHGSGNAGATNALRTYGKAAAAYVTLGDCLKTSICCVIGIIAAHITPLGAENVNSAYTPPESARLSVTTSRFTSVLKAERAFWYQLPHLYLPTPLLA